MFCIRMGVKTVFVYAKWRHGSRIGFGSLVLVILKVNVWISAGTIDKMGFQVSPSKCENLGRFNPLSVSLNMK